MDLGAERKSSKSQKHPLTKSLGDAQAGKAKFGPRVSGKKKEPKPKLFGPDIFGWGGGLPHEGGGGQKVRYVLRNPGKASFSAGYPGTFGRDIPMVREKFEKKKVRVQFSDPRVGPRVC